MESNIATNFNRIGRPWQDSKNKACRNGGPQDIIRGPKPFIEIKSNHCPN